MNVHKRLETLLIRLEADLRAMSLWDVQPPGQEALCSELPFSHDTLEFYQWLQWIFLPRTRMLTRNQTALPGSSDIHSMAELYFQTQAKKSAAVLETIKLIDQIFSPGP